jgi:hypothetical protein
MSVDSYYQGPSKADYFDALASYEEARFNMQRAASLAGKALDAWEKRGGIKDDIRDGYKLRQMQPDEQRAELRRQFRVAGWHGIVDEDVAGQRNFLKVFDAPPVEPAMGIGGAPIGSQLSRVRALASGFNDGKQRKGPSLQDGIELYGFPADSDEALAYAEGWGDGFKLRPAEKVKKIDPEDLDEPEASLRDQVAAELDRQEAEKQGEPAKRGRGRPRKDAAAGDNVVPMARPTAALPPPDAAWPPGESLGGEMPGPAA